MSPPVENHWCRSLDHFNVFLLHILTKRLVVSTPPPPSTPAASAASEQKNFDEESIASVSTSAHNETRDGFCPDDLAETSALQALQERTYGFSFWPKVGGWSCA